MSELQNIARALGRQLCGRVAHVVGVSLVRRDSEVPQLELFVDVDSDEPIANLPRSFRGVEVHVRKVGKPVFARV